MIKTVLDVKGMACEGCESRVNNIIKKEYKIKRVTSSYEKGEIEIISVAQIDKEAIKARIEEAGFQVLNVTSEEYREKGLFGFGK